MILKDDFDPLEFLRKKQADQAGQPDRGMNFSQDPAPAIPPLQVEPTDQVILGASQKRDDLLKQQEQLKNQAGKAGEYTSQEKIASGIALALPTLLGAIVGGALGGPQAALAGFGGGATGGAEGLKGLQARKDAKVKDLTNQASELSARIDAADAEIARRKDRLEDRALSKEEKEKERAQIEKLTADKLVAEEKLLGKKLSAEERIARMNNSARRGDLLLQNAGNLQREQMDTERALLLAGQQAQKEANKAAKEQKLTESQANALLYGALARTAQDAIDDLDARGYDRTKLTEGVDTLAPNALQDPSTQQAINAERNFVAAVLRKTSGAAISEKEWKDTAPLYFERANDSKEVRAQKRAMRQTFLNSLAATLGSDGMELINRTAAPIKYEQEPKNVGKSEQDILQEKRKSIDSKIKWK